MTKRFFQARVARTQIGRGRILTYATASTAGPVADTAPYTQHSDSVSSGKVLLGTVKIEIRHAVVGGGLSIFVNGFDILSELNLGSVGTRTEYRELLLPAGEEFTCYAPVYIKACD